MADKKDESCRFRLGWRPVAGVVDPGPGISAVSDRG